MNRIEKNRTKPSRSRPVSCLFCRNRKLRCSRTFPCTNCLSRGLACQQDDPPPPKAKSSVGNPFEASATFEIDVLARLRTLEELVIGKNRAPQSAKNGSPMQTGSPAVQPSPASYSPPVDNHRDQYRSPASDVNWLEGEITHPGSMNCLRPFEVEFKSCSINAAASSSPSSSLNGENTSTRCIWLPLQRESKQIVDKYLTDITHLHHVVHAPSVRSMVNNIYEKLEQKYPLRLGDVSLLLAIITSSAFFWTKYDTPRAVFTSAEEADEQVPVWLRRTLEVLEYSRRVAAHSIEDIQATIIAGFVICNMVGISSQAHSWFAFATSNAWHLSLHRIDHPNNGELKTPPPDSIEAEVGRRVWWNLVGTDWQFSQFAGPQRGIYMINPRHMATRKPINVNDEDLVDGMERVGQPIDQPTSMSYCLQRYRLAELCRELTDSEPFESTIGDETDYQRIRDIDAKMVAFINGVPSFFSLDHKTAELPDTDPRISTPITVQRYIINCLFHAQRCRLHLPFLTKSLKESKYHYSRDACLDAARKVIRTERQLRTENVPFAMGRLRSSGILHCVCMAIIVLLLDLCVNKDLQTEDDRELRMEIFSAFTVLEEAEGQTPFAGKILSSFYSVLQRYNIPFVRPDSGISIGSEGSPQIPSKQPLALVSHPNPKSLPKSQSATDDLLSDPTLPSFNDVWQEFDMNVDQLSLDWETLFAELESPFLKM